MTEIHIFINTIRILSAHYEDVLEIGKQFYEENEALVSEKTMENIKSLKYTLILKADTAASLGTLYDSFRHNNNLKVIYKLFHKKFIILIQYYIVDYQSRDWLYKHK